MVALSDGVLEERNDLAFCSSGQDHKACVAVLIVYHCHCLPLRIYFSTLLVPWLYLLSLLPYRRIHHSSPAIKPDLVLVF